MSDSTLPLSLQYAKKYVKRGWQPIPVPRGSKKPDLADWPNFRCTESDLPQYFSNDSNVGLLTGAVSNNLVCVDFDCRFARMLAAELMPSTGLISGRKSVGISHKWYLCRVETAKYKDPDCKENEKGMLVELRSGGCQTLVPPSDHPTREAYEWFAKGQPATVEPAVLQTAVRRVAAASLLARNWQEGKRHDLVLCLSGGLLRQGWKQSDVENFILQVARAAGDDQWKDHRASLESTARKLATGKVCWGLPALKKRLPEKTFERVVEWLEVTSGADVKKEKTEKRAPVIADIEPWPEPVDGAALLNELAAFFSDYVDATEAQLRTVALWTLHTHAIDAFDLTPYLLLTSATMRSGKSTLLRLAGAVSRRPFAVSSASAAVVYRLVDEFSPTLLLDECDAYLGEAEELRGILNAGHTRDTAKVARCNKSTGEVEIFDAFTPKAIAMIGKPKPTLVDRSVIVPLRRKAPSGRNLSRLRLRKLPELTEPLRARAARFALDHMDELATAEPAIPTRITSDRACDNWETLLSIADAAGGEWPQLARGAAIELSGAADVSDAAVSEILITDLYELFVKEQPTADRIETKDILFYLHDLERPWAEMERTGKPLSSTALAALLRPYGVKPERRREGKKLVRAYFRSSLADAFNRYCVPASGGVESSQSEQPFVFNDLQENQVVTNSNSVTTCESGKSFVSNVVPTVTTQNPPTAKERESLLLEWGFTVADIAGMDEGEVEQIFATFTA